MAKSSHRDEIKQEKFKDRNLTPLGSLKRSKNTIQNPFSILGRDKLQTTSWFDQALPNILWAAIVITTLERDVGLEIFRQVVRSAIDSVVRRKELFVTHNYLAIATADEFDAMMQPVLNSAMLKDVMPALLSIEWLPDRGHWARHYEPIDDYIAYNILMEAIGRTHEHQSQSATDIRWLKIMSLIFVQERMVFGPAFEERLKEFSDYPNRGDMRAVRPSIRAMEISTRPMELGEEVAEHWPEDRPKLPAYEAESFWTEMHAKTPCLIPSRFKSSEMGPEEARNDLVNVSELVAEHYHKTSSTTAADPRHEGAFGLVLYAYHLAISTAITPINTLADGRIILRSILEVFITFHYLATKDDYTIWLQYRKYGQGQTKLAFLKNIREDEIPDFIDLEEMEAFANEDRWMEFEDIELGHWANLNLRKMANEVGLKGLYDKYYDWSSGFVHAQWASARSTVFINCFNPLHRFHRIPGPLLPAMPSTLVDISKILNRMLDDLNTLYPAFKPRLTWHKKVHVDDGVDPPATDERREFYSSVLGEEVAVRKHSPEAD